MHLCLFYFCTNFYYKSVTGFFLKDVSSFTANFTAKEKAQGPGYYVRKSHCNVSCVISCCIYCGENCDLFCCNKCCIQNKWDSGLRMKYLSMYSLALDTSLFVKFFALFFVHCRKNQRTFLLQEFTT